MRGYGCFVAMMSALTVLTLAPLAILAFIHPAEALARLRFLGIALGFYVAVIGPTLYVTIKRDPPSVPRHASRPVPNDEAVTKPLRLASVHALQQPETPAFARRSGEARP